MKESLTKIFIKLPIENIGITLTVALCMLSLFLSVVLMQITSNSSNPLLSFLLIISLFIPLLLIGLGSYVTDKLKTLQDNIKTSIKNKKLKKTRYRDKYPECSDRINSYCYGLLVDNPFYQRGTKICRDCFCPLKFAMMINDDRKEKETCK
ncbi:MAG: hypothetical protein DKM24_00940 [Candidatus Melainabacteria bacterium]|nr:MAG: hypothetical protein DKM24_00940 [Candidatus Melainabacteria bacterium]